MYLSFIKCIEKVWAQFVRMLLFFLIFIKFKHIYTILIINNINCNAILIVNLVNNYLIVLIKKFKRLPQQSSG